MPNVNVDIYATGEQGITFCAIKDIQPPDEIVLILTKVDIDGMENVPHSDVAME